MPYYHLLENEEIVDDLLREFRLDPEKGHIINGHVPVHQSEGESPVKCNGKVLVIDGGFSRPYQKVTGIAGYTTGFITPIGTESCLLMSLLLLRKKR